MLGTAGLAPSALTRLFFCLRVSSKQTVLKAFQVYASRNTFAYSEIFTEILSLIIVVVIT